MSKHRIIASARPCYQPQISGQQQVADTARQQVYDVICNEAESWVQGLLRRLARQPVEVRATVAGGSLCVEAWPEAVDARKLIGFNGKTFRAFEVLVGQYSMKHGLTWLNGCYICHTPQEQVSQREPTARTDPLWPRLPLEALVTDTAAALFDETVDCIWDHGELWKCPFCGKVGKYLQLANNVHIPQGWKPGQQPECTVLGSELEQHQQQGTESRVRLLLPDAEPERLPDAQVGDAMATVFHAIGLANGRRLVLELRREE